MALRYLTLPIIIFLVWVFTAITSLLGIYRDWAREAVFVSLLLFALVDPKLFTRKGRVLSRIIKRKKRIFASEKNAAEFAQKSLAKEYSTSSFVIVPDLSPDSEYGIHTSENGSKYYVGKVVRKGDRSGTSEVFISEEGEWLDNVYINFFRGRIFSDLTPSLGSTKIRQPLTSLDSSAHGKATQCGSPPRTMPNSLSREISAPASLLQ